MPNRATGRTMAPDLTEAEQQILVLVREGRVDAEIGVRLGLPVSEVKARIERLCARLGVADKASLRLTFSPEPQAPITADVIARTNTHKRLLTLLG